jgi:hypothetical protein
MTIDGPDILIAIGSVIALIGVVWQITRWWRKT